VPDPNHTPGDAAVFAALEPMLARAGVSAIGGIRRRPSAYRTSFPLEEIEVDGEDGTVRLAFKRLGWSELDGNARLAKPRFLHDPRREPAVYESLLGPAAIGAPRLFGSSVDPDRERYWLFVEWVDGRELHQVGDRSLWEAAAAWLARMHEQLGADLEQHARSGRLLDHNASFYRLWMQRAREFAKAAADHASPAPALDWLARRHESVVEALLSLPRTVIHGEFYASNVLVGGDAAEPRVAPVDWEVAAVGPGLTDLAALVGGDWPAPDRSAIAAAYGAVAPHRDLDFARLQLAVQWLGWAPPTWSPPPGQRHDWLAEALELAEGLEL
jgi:hypothetical protein